MEIDKSQTKSTNGSRLSKIENNKNNISEDISMSQLELLANKKKLNKKSEEISLNNEQQIDSDITNEKKKISTISSKSPRKKSTIHKKIESSISSDLSETSTEFKKRTKLT